MKIAFIGLGIMGSRMAANLLKHGNSLRVYNRSRAASEALQGAYIADSAAEAVAGADLVFTMLSTPEVVREIAFGANGFVQAMQKDAIWADCSTVNPSFSREMAAAASQEGIHFLDSPVGGSKGPAGEGTLAFFVGGSAEALEKARPYMEQMGSRVIHTGANGQGSALKMLVNSMLAQSMAVFAENLLLGEKMGFSRDWLLDFLPKLPVIAPFTQAKAAKIKANDFEVEFPLEWMHKDIHLATLTGYELGQALPVSNAVKEVFALALKNGLNREDFSAVVKALEE